MSEMFFDANHLPNLMSRKSDLFPKEELSKQYLGGVDFIDENLGFEEACTFFPEPQDECMARNKRLIDKLCLDYS
jgi:hypothetical protein